MSNNMLKVEEVGAPQEVTPEQRYAQLHRDIERGLESDRCWSELCEVCIALGKVGEAVQTLRRVNSTTETVRLARMLEKNGVIVSHLLKQVVQEVPASVTPSVALPAVVAPVAPAPAPAWSAPRGRPSDTPTAAEARQAGPAESFFEECREACAFLMRDQMPLAAMGLVLLFPLATALGFLLPGTIGTLLGLVLRLLPIAAVLGLALHVARRVLIDAAQGNEDPPLPSEMVRGGWRGAATALAGVLSVVFFSFGPCLIGAALGLPWHELIGLSLLGIVYSPVALLGMAMRGSFEDMLPNRVWRVAAVDALGTFKLAAFFGVVVVLPVAGVFFVSSGAAHLRIAIVGPILVGPLLALGRLLGRYAWAHGGDMHRALNMVVENVPLVRAGGRAPVAVRRAQPDRKPSPRLARRSPARGAPRAQRLSSAPVERHVTANPPAPRKQPAGSPQPQPQPQRRVTAPAASALSGHTRGRSPFVVGHSTPTPATYDDPRVAPQHDPSAAEAAARRQKPLARPTPRPVQPRDVHAQPPSPATGRAPERRQPAVERPETRQPPRHPLPPPGRSMPPKKPRQS